jgi:hypothetical protein
MRNFRVIFILLCITFLLLGCTSDDNSTTMKIEISEEGQPLSKYEVCLYEVKKPIYSKWQFHKLECEVSENGGTISFNVKKNGHYRIDISGSNGFYYTNDFIRVKDFEKIKIFNFIYEKDEVKVLLYFNKKWVNPSK